MAKKPRKPADPLRPPKHLDARSRQEWKRTLAAIRVQREPNASHLSALRRYIHAWELYTRAADAIATASAAEIEPLTQALARCDRLLRNASQDLGIGRPDLRHDQFVTPFRPFDSSEAEPWP